jgi:hypothetical protein
MTMKEFEGWVSDNYEELVKLARSVVGQEGQDLLHNMIEGMCEGREKLPPMPIEKMGVGVFAKYLLNDRYNATDADQNRRQAMESFAGSLNALGPDVYLDTSLGSGRPGDELPSEIGKAIRARKERERRAATTDPACSLEAINSLRFEGRIEGNVRWRFQQMRDGRLFDERAVRSLAESMHRASHRHLYFSEAGHSQMEWGLEDLATSRPDDRALGKQILIKRRQEVAR